MELVIGGAYQGKQDVAVRIFELNPAEILNGEDCSLRHLEFQQGLIQTYEQPHLAFPDTLHLSLIPFFPPIKI